MGTQITLIIGSVIALFVAWLITKKHTKRPSFDDFPYQARPLQTDTEVRFFHALHTAMPEYYIMVQVALSRVVDAEHTDEPQFWFNRICRQSVDYVLVAPDGQTVILAIELDDWTHDNPKRKTQDAKKDAALLAAGIPIMRYYPQDKYSVKQMRTQIIEAISE